MDACRILVAEDDAAMGGLLRDQLMAWGYEVVSADSEERALSLLTGTGSFQIVLSDMHMPPGDGFHLLAAIRSRWPRTAVVLMSAFPAPETGKQVLEAGASAFLAKPFCMAELREALKRSLPHA